MVFNPASGDTHILDIASGEVLAALMARPAALAPLAARLGGLLELDNDAELEAAAAQILDRLAALGLIEPAAPC